MKQIPELDKKGLRDFALVTSLIVCILFGLFIPWLFEFQWPIWPWILGGTLSLVGLTVPNALRPVYKGWMTFGLLLNKIVTPIIMGIVFFLVVTPTGLIRRMFVRNTLDRNFDDSESYRKVSEEKPPSTLERPF